MQCVGNVVHTEKFVSRTSGKEFTKLFVPIGYNVVAVIANGDLTALAGVEGVPFRLGFNKDKQLQLYFDGEEE